MRPSAVSTRLPGYSPAADQDNPSPRATSESAYNTTASKPDLDEPQRFSTSPARCPPRSFISYSESVSAPQPSGPAKPVVHGLDTPPMRVTVSTSAATKPETRS